MQISTIKLPDKPILEKLGLSWHTDEDSSLYISDELISITQSEAEAYYEACNTLYDMFVEAGEYVIKKDLFFELDIPPSLVGMIKQSFEEEVHWHLYGRFDLSGGLDGKPIKLLEFNADTPTMLYESALLQWALLKFNGLDENLQFNHIREALSENFKRLITLEADTSRFGEIYEGWKILFCSTSDSVEDITTTRFLEHIARESGFVSDFAPIDKVRFSPSEGVNFNGTNYEFLFKLIPWENIAIDEPELAALMSEMMSNHNTIFLNPAYTLLFQSKRMLKILWDLFPNHPLLLEADFSPLKNTKQVCKRAFGREGANVEIIDSQGQVIERKEGIYGNHKCVYQAFSELNSHKGIIYQPNVFFAYEACGLGFRRSENLIIDNFSKFVSHCIV